MDAFNALKEMLKDFVMDTILSSISSFIDGIWSGVVSWGSGLVALLYQLSEQVDVGSLSESNAADQFIDALIFNGVFIAVVALAIALYAVMLILTPVTAPYAFVLSEIAPLLIVAILMGGSGLLTGASSSGVALASDIIGMICDTLGNGLINAETTFFGIVFATIGSMMTSVAAAVKVCVNTILSFAVSIIGAILSFAALTQINEHTSLKWVKLAAVGLAFSGIGFILALTGPNLDKKICPGFTAVSTLISGLGFGVSILSLGETYQKYAAGG